METDFSLFHLYDDEEQMEYTNPAYLPDYFGDGADSGGSLEIEHYDGDGEARSIETLTEYDRSQL